MEETISVRRIVIYIVDPLVTARVPVSGAGFGVKIDRPSPVFCDCAEYHPVPPNTNADMHRI